MKIISFFTVETPYQLEVETLRNSCNLFNYELIAIPRANQLNWEANCNMKPFIILEALSLMERGEETFYLDADAVIVKPLEYIPKEDFAVYKQKNNVLSGTIFIRKTDYSMKIIHAWCEKVRSNLTLWDQVHLTEVLKDFEHGILPATYCKIIDSQTKNPVIIHNQASRKYKITVRGRMKLPEKLGKSRYIYNPDGTVSIPRRDREAEEWFDKNMERCGAELRWAPKMNSDTLAGLKLEGNEATIIGKGPSLDLIKAEDLIGPVICINESIKKIEEINPENPVYAICQDDWLKDSCVPKLETSKALVSVNLRNYYSRCPYVFTFVPREVIPRGAMNITANIAISILKNKGFKKINMLAFDAALGQSTDYAKIVGYKSSDKGDPNRFKNHRAAMESVGKGLYLNFIKLSPERKRS